jgi:hypothetical protein
MPSKMTLFGPVEQPRRVVASSAGRRHQGQEDDIRGAKQCWSDYRRRKAQE